MPCTGTNLCPHRFVTALFITTTTRKDTHMPCTVRTYRPTDAAGVAGLFNAHPDNPNPVVGGITPDELDRELAERGTLAFFVATDQPSDDPGAPEGPIVATFGLFRTNGRRLVPERHALMDMFFVAPQYRCTTVAGQLFDAAITWLHTAGFEVCRLTVNPANSTAFKLYRRVGCISQGYASPGEDGNVELVNYLPMVMQATGPFLTPEEGMILRGNASWGCCTEPRDDQLESDVSVVEGRHVIEYEATVAQMSVRATVDVDAGAVVSATVSHPPAAARQLPLPPVPQPASMSADPVVVSAGDWQLRVDPRFGRTELWRRGHLGPVWATSLAHPLADLAAGWRVSPPRDLQVSVQGEMITIDDRDSGLTCRYLLCADRLEQHLSAPGATRLRQFHAVGLRGGYFTATAVDGRSWCTQPTGLDLAVRDASEIVAAAIELDPAAPVSWADPQQVPVVSAEGSGLRLVHSTLLDHRVRVDADGVARFALTLGTSVAGTGATVPEERAPASSTVATPDPQLDARAGGVAVWRDGRTRLLRSPHPRSEQRFACNPHWRSGLWVTREAPRHTASQGMGWGVAETGWKSTPEGLTHSRLGLALRLTAEAVGSWLVEVQGPAGEHEHVVWITPATPAEGAIGVPGAGDQPLWLPIGGRWQRWTGAVAVPLADGTWLAVEALPGQDAATAELIVRDTPSGPLIGCVATATGQPVAWRLQRHDRAPVQLLGRTHSAREADPAA